MRILFMGTPEYAQICLRSLYEEGENEIIGVVTQPDKPKGRGYTLTPSAVKVYALEKGIPVYQPERLKDGAFEETLKQIDPELIAVVAYGKILPRYILEYPKYGCINVHGSLLPKYRGAAPMQRAIINGEKTTGVTTMYMEEGLDTGDMIEMYEIQIKENDNFESVHDKLADLGAFALCSTVKSIKKGGIKRYKQDDSKATYAEKINKEDCIVDFTKSAKVIHDQIRGTSPFPLSFAFLNGKMIKFIGSEISDEPSGKPGEVVSLKNGLIHISTSDGVVAINSVLPEGKGRMKSSDFINGRKVSVGDIFVSQKE